LPVHVLTDSTSYLPRELAANLGIEVLSLYYCLDDHDFKRELDLDELTSFYDALQESGEVARTSPPSVDDFLRAYEPLLADGSSVISVHISSGMSDTCTHARQAAERLEAEGKGGERVHVIDSAGAGGKTGIVALAARAAAVGGNAEEAAERAREARQETQMRILLNTLEFLRRGGRIGTAAAWLGSALDIKPILSVESELKGVERVRTLERGKEHLIEFARRLAAGGADAWFVQHAKAPEEARALVERLQEVFWRPPEFVSELGPVIGTHVGPGFVGVGAMPSRFLD